MASAACLSDLSGVMILRQGMHFVDMSLLMLLLTLGLHGYLLVLLLGDLLQPHFLGNSSADWLE